MKTKKQPKVLYLAVPYSHLCPLTRESRYQKACYVASKLMRAGVIVFSPLSHSVPIAKYVGEVDDHEFWLGQDIPLLHRCDELLMVALDGWHKSRGVRKEMYEAFALGKPITIITEADIERLPAVPKNARRYFQSKILTETYDGNQ